MKNAEIAVKGTRRSNITFNVCGVMIVDPNSIGESGYALTKVDFDKYLSKLKALVIGADKYQLIELLNRICKEFLTDDQFVQCVYTVSDVLFNQKTVRATSVLEEEILTEPSNKDANNNEESKQKDSSVEGGEQESSPEKAVPRRKVTAKIVSNMLGTILKDLLPENLEEDLLTDYNLVVGKISIAIGDRKMKMSYSEICDIVKEFIMASNMDAYAPEYGYANVRIKEAIVEYIDNSEDDKYSPAKLTFVLAGDQAQDQDHEEIEESPAENETPRENPIGDKLKNAMERIAFLEEELKKHGTVHVSVSKNLKDVITVSQKDNVIMIKRKPKAKK